MPRRGKPVGKRNSYSVFLPLSWRAGKAGVARHSPAIPQRTEKDLVHEHVRSLDANAFDSGEDTDHRMHSLFGSLRDSIQARLLNLRDLVHDEA